MCVYVCAFVFDWCRLVQVSAAQRRPTASGAFKSRLTVDEQGEFAYKKVRGGGCDSVRGEGDSVRGRGGEGLVYLVCS